MKSTITKITALTFFGLTAVGCSSVNKSDIDQLRAELSEVRATASKALSVAEQARTTADDAMDSSKRTEEIVNRSFKKSMLK